MRFSVPRTVLRCLRCLGTGVCVARSMYWRVRVRSLRETLCGFSHRAGRARGLTYLTFLVHLRVTPMSRSRMKRGSEPTCVPSARLRRIWRSWVSTGWMNIAGHGEERASDTRGARRQKRHGLPPVKPANAVVPLWCGILSSPERD